MVWFPPLCVFVEARVSPCLSWATHCGGALGCLWVCLCAGWSGESLFVTVVRSQIYLMYRVIGPLVRVVCCRVLSCCVIMSPWRMGRAGSVVAVLVARQKCSTYGG